MTSGVYLRGEAALTNLHDRPRFQPPSRRFACVLSSSSAASVRLPRLTKGNAPSFPPGHLNNHRPVVFEPLSLTARNRFDAAVGSAGDDLQRLDVAKIERTIEARRQDLRSMSLHRCASPPANEPKTTPEVA